MHPQGSCGKPLAITQQRDNVEPEPPHIGMTPSRPDVRISGPPEQIHEMRLYFGK